MTVKEIFEIIELPIPEAEVYFQPGIGWWCVKSYYTDYYLLRDSGWKLNTDRWDNDFIPDLDLSSLDYIPAFNTFPIAIQERIKSYDYCINDIKKFQSIITAQGMHLSDLEVRSVWEAYSADYCAGWLTSVGHNEASILKIFQEYSPKVSLETLQKQVIEIKKKLAKLEEKCCRKT